MNPFGIRRQAAGIVIPDPAAPAGNYVGWNRSGNTVDVSGQLPLEAGSIAVKGRLGEDLGINGASDLMVEVFGEAGRHARFAVGVATLPGGAAVEVHAAFEVAA